LDEEPGQTNPMSYLADMQMMVIHKGAKERTEAEFAALFAHSGFNSPRVQATRSPFYIVEAQPV
jgi:hypothetical protein